ncbi:MAG: GNAT family N-acetyltransferase [Peptostreptococcaceae bacterium]
MFKVKHFNDLTINELYEIVKARYEVFACEQRIFGENDFDDVDKVSYHVFYENNDNVCAYCRIIPKEYSSYDDTSIGRVLTTPNCRNKGLAKKMMLFSIDFVNDYLNEKHIILSAQEYIKNLYLSCGFKEISEVYDEVGIPHIKMRL